MKSVKQMEKSFELLVKQIKASTPAPIGESSHARKERVDHLLNHPAEAMKYYFPKWAKSDFAPFHLRGIDTVMNWPEPKLFFAWAASRNLSKTTFWQMFAIIINLRKIRGMSKGFEAGLWMSKTFDQAAKQVTAMRAQFEGNERLINDFGVFKTVSQWGDNFFRTSQGISWIPLGKGQSPRGLKDEDVRVNLQIWDDFDDDEECLNDKRIEKSWDWITHALIPTLDVSEPGLIVMLNNIIHENSLMNRVIGNVKDVNKLADWHEVVNLMNDSRTKATWSARHSVEQCRYMIDKIGSIAAEAEYFNNPITSGKVIKKEWIQWKPMQNLREYAAIVAYLDPSFSNKKNADHKSWVVLGFKDGEIHVIKAFCDRASIEEMVEWGYDIEKYVKSRHGAVELWMEEVFYQSLLYKDFGAAAKLKGYPLPISGDKRDKPDKDRRILACQGYFERGEVYFNEDERDNHHMKNLVNQWICFEAGHTGIKKDGPDAWEGGKEILIGRVQAAGTAAYGRRSKSKHMY